MDNLPIRIETKRMIFFSTSATNSPALPCPSFIVHIQAPITPVLPFAYFVVLALAPFSAVLHIFFLVLKIQAPFFDVLPFLAISLLATASVNLHFLLSTLSCCILPSLCFGPQFVPSLTRSVLFSLLPTHIHA